MKQLDMEGFHQVHPLSTMSDENSEASPEYHDKHTDTAPYQGITPRGFKAAFKTFLGQIFLPVAVVVYIPLCFYTNGERVLPYEKRNTMLQDIIIGWESLLRMSVWPIVAVSGIVALSLAHSRHQDCRPRYSIEKCLNEHRHSRKWPLGATATGVIVASLFFSLGVTIQSQLQIIVPSRIWNPFLWGSYKIYYPEGISDAVKNLCIESDLKVLESSKAEPLCLKEASWKTLSSGLISSRNPEDVRTIREGIKVAQKDSFGLIISVMARDTAGTIETLRQNIEGVVPFVSKLSVVVFENDSLDGTREAFKKWSVDVKEEYTVDVMECPDALDCKFGISHRYDSTESKNFYTSSAIGRMAEFRQRIVDYVQANSSYDNYSHILVMDVDLGISLSPLGVIHALGKKPNVAVASAAHQPWPGSLGSITPEYDFSAFRAIETHGIDAFSGFIPNSAI